MTWQLCLVEARRLLRSPYPWSAVLVAVLGLTALTWQQQPNLAAAAVNAAAAASLVALALLVISNLASLRDQQPGMAEVLAALPATAAVRTRALLLAAGGVGALLAVLVTGAHVAVRVAQGPTVGRVDPGEMLAGAAAVSFLAVAGVALGRWVPSPVVVPAVLFGLAGLIVFGGAAIAPWHLPVTVPYELEAFGRPSWSRAAWLVAAAVALAALALLRHGRDRLRLVSVGTATLVMLVAAIVTAVMAPPMWSRVAPDADRSDWEPARICTKRGDVTYCHFPGFASWVDRWDRAAAPIAAAVPDSGTARLPAVVQYQRPSMTWAQPGQVMVGTSWGRGPAESENRASLAGSVAVEVTGLAEATRRPGGTGWSYACSGHDQARTVVALWLVGQVVALPDDASGDSLLPAVRYGDDELLLARALLESPEAEDWIAAHWTQLLDPTISMPAVASDPGMEPPVPDSDPGSAPGPGSVTEPGSGPDSSSLLPCR